MILTLKPKPDMELIGKNTVAICAQWDTEDWENKARVLLRTIGNQERSTPLNAWEMQMMMELVEELVLPKFGRDGRTCAKNQS